MKTGTEHKLLWIMIAIPVLVVILLPLLRGCR